MTRIYNEGLFRQQAIRSLSEKRSGRPICIMPRPWLWLNGLVTLLFVSLTLFVGSAEYARKETVRGWLVSKEGVVRIASSVPAVISDIARKPGDHVIAGEPLIYLSTDTTLSDGHSKSELALTQLRQQVVEIDTQLDFSLEQQQLDRVSLQQQLKDFDAEIAALDSRLSEQRHQIELSDDKLRRLEGAILDGAVTHWDVIRQQEDQSTLEQELSRLLQDAASMQRERELVAGRQSSVPVQGGMQRSELRARRTQLLQQIDEQESRRLTVVISPVSGIVAAVEVGAGNAIAPQQLLMTILPEEMNLAAEIYVPSKAAGFVKPGQLVRIAYDAFPQQKFGTFEGRVERVSDFVLLPGEIPQTFPLLEATYKVRIEISDSAIATSLGTLRLRPGMLLVAEVILEKRNLADWLLEPLRFRRSTSG